MLHLRLLDAQWILYRTHKQWVSSLILGLWHQKTIQCLICDRSNWGSCDYWSCWGVDMFAFLSISSWHIIISISPPLPLCPPFQFPQNFRCPLLCWAPLPIQKTEWWRLETAQKRFLHTPPPLLILHYPLIMTWWFTLPLNHYPPLLKNGFPYHSLIVNPELNNWCLISHGVWGYMTWCAYFFASKMRKWEPKTIKHFENAFTNQPKML